MATSRLQDVRDLIDQKIHALVQVEIATDDDALLEQVHEEIMLCDKWMDLLDSDDDVSELPTPAQDQGLLDAIKAVQQCIDRSSGLNALVSATTTLINAFKAPG